MYRVFPFEDGKDEVMLHGYTDMNLRAGGTKKFIWSARLKFAWTEAGVLIHRYTVISVSSLFSAPIACPNCLLTFTLGSYSAIRRDVGCVNSTTRTVRYRINCIA